MIKKYREKYEKTRNVKNNDKLKTFILRGERNQKYYDKTLSKNTQKNNFIILNEFYNFIIDNSTLSNE